MADEIEVPPDATPAEGVPLPVAGTVAGIAMQGSGTDIPFEATPPPEPPERPRRDGTLVERATLAAFWNAAFLPLKLIVKLLASIVVVRVLTRADFTVVTQLQALLGTLGMISDLGLERALPRFIPEFEMADGRAGLSRLLRNVSLVKALTMVPFVLSLVLFPDFFTTQFHIETASARIMGQRGPDYDPFLLGMIAAMLVLGAASDVSIQVLYAYFRQKMTNALDILNALLIPGLQALLVGVFKLSVFGALVALLVGTAVSVVLSLRLMFRALGDERLGLRKVAHRPPKAGPAPNGRTPRRPSTRSVWQRFTAYSAMMYVMTLSSALYDQSLVVLALGLLITDNVRLATEVALIGLAFKFVRQLLQALVVPLTGVQTPLFARLYAEGRLDGLQTAYASLTRFLILVLLPAGVGLIIMSRNLLVLLYLQPNKTNVLPPDQLAAAVTACAILTIGLFGESMISIALNVLMVYEDYQAVLIARAFALLSIPLLIVLEPPFGVVGVAAAVSIAALSSRFVALIFGLRRLELQFPLAFLGRVALATLPILVVIGPLALLLPDAPPKIPSLEWFMLGFANAGLVLAAVFLFWLVFRRLGGLLAEDKQRFAGMRLPGIKLLLRYM